MAERSLADLERENAYLKLRLAQLESDLVHLQAEHVRMMERERTHARRAARAPSPLGGGQ
jgi:hypothetical protein